MTMCRNILTVSNVNMQMCVDEQPPFCLLMLNTLLIGPWLE